MTICITNSSSLIASANANNEAGEQQSISNQLPRDAAVAARELRRQGPVYSQDGALALAATAEGDPDLAEIDLFCTKLSGHRGRPFWDVRRELEKLPLPSGFLHVRIFVKGTEKPFCRISRRDHQPVDTKSVLSAACREHLHLVPWSRIEPLDVVDRGVLDLAVTYTV